MSNHYHLILETPLGNLSQIMKHINSAYTTYYTIKRKRAGHLLQGRCKAIVVVAPVAPAIRGYFSPVCAEIKASTPTVTNNMSGLLMEVGATSRNIQDLPRQVDTYHD